MMVTYKNPEPTKSRPTDELSILDAAKRRAKQTIHRRHDELTHEIKNDFKKNTDIAFRHDFFSPDVRIAKDVKNAFKQLGDDLHSRHRRDESRTKYEHNLRTMLDNASIESVTKRRDDLRHQTTLTVRDKNFIQTFDIQGPKAALDKTKQSLRSLLDHSKRDHETQAKSESHPLSRLLNKLQKANTDFGKAEVNLGINVVHGSYQAVKTAFQGTIGLVGYAVGHGVAVAEGVKDGMAEVAKRSANAAVKKTLKTVYNK